MRLTTMLGVGWGMFGVAPLFPLFQSPVPMHCHVPNCLTNVKIQAMSLGIYSADSGERMPPKSVWMDRLSNYLDRDSRFLDPALGDKGYGYAFSPSLSGATAPSQPELAVAVFDSWKLRRNVSDAMTSLPPEGRHDGKNHFGFVDGHAKAVRAGDSWVSDASQ